eukprot:sb/3466419/
MAVVGMTMAALGTLPLLAASLVSDWRKSYYITIIYSLISHLTLVFLPESPRSDIIRGKVAQAEASFRRIAKINKTEWKGFDSDPGHGKELESEQENVSIKDQIKTFFLHKILFLETLALMTLWVVVFLCFYGISYAWDKVVPVASSGYFFSMAVQIAANIAFVPVMRALGRRRYMGWSFVISALFLTIGGATSTVNLGNNGWTVASVASILAQFFISGLYTGLFMWNIELPPCTHTGTVIGLCSSSSKVFGLACPFLFGSLADATGGFVVSFSIMVGLCLVGALCSYLLPETFGQPIASSPEEVKQRRRRLRSNRYGYHGNHGNHGNKILPRGNTPLENL